jgi:hypothetical protein
MAKKNPNARAAGLYFARKRNRKAAAALTPAAPAAPLKRNVASSFADATRSVTDAPTASGTSTKKDKPLRGKKPPK